MFKKSQSSPKTHKTKRFLHPKFKSKKTTGEIDDQVPRITNETVIQHREEVLGGARKFIYPLRQSRHKIVLFTVAILVAVAIGFMGYTLLNLYKWQSTSAFMYQVTKVVPLPVARIGNTFVAYENYLFELRHYIHYYETQQDVDFASDQGKIQLAEQRSKSLENSINYAYAKKIAKQNNISISKAEVDAQIDILKSQNKLGNDNKVFENVLKDYWGWTVADFRRSIEQELLTTKVLHKLDVDTKSRANTALKEITAGKDFAEVAKQYSDDSTTKSRGGDLGVLVSKADNNILLLPYNIIDALFKLNVNEVTGILDNGYGLIIVKNLKIEGDKRQVAVVFFAYKDINYYLNDYKEKQKAQVYIKI